MTKFKSKAQRKAVMRLVKQDKMNMKHAKKGKSESTEPYPNLTKQVLNLKKHDEPAYHLFMKKAFFKGNKGTVIPKLVPNGKFDEHGKPWYTTSVLETRKHLVKGKGDFHYVTKFNTPYKVKKKDLKNPNFKLYR
jgi:hypothetical protein